MECSSKTSQLDCTCTYTGCERHGHCCQCVAYHRDRHEVPGCFFTPDGERRYDRSLKHFMRDRKG